MFVLKNIKMIRYVIFGSRFLRVSSQRDSRKKIHCQSYQRTQ